MPRDGRKARGRGPAQHLDAAQLVAQVGHGRVICLQPGRPVARGRSDPHQVPVRGLTEWVELDQPAEELHRAAIFTTLLEVGHEAFGGLDLQPLEPLAVGLDPVVIAGRQERAVVQPNGLLERGRVTGSSPLDGRLELGDVEAERPIGSPVDRPTVEHDQTVGLGQRPAQQVELAAEVGQRLGIARVGPQREGELVAGHRSVAVHKQVGHERFEPWRADALDPRAADGQLEVAEQLDREFVAHVPFVPLARHPAHLDRWRGEQRLEDHAVALGTFLETLQPVGR